MVSFRSLNTTVTRKPPGEKLQNAFFGKMLGGQWVLTDRSLGLIKYTNSIAITRIGKFYYLLAHWHTAWYYFYPIDPKARAKLAGIVNKVYWIIERSHVHVHVSYLVMRLSYSECSDSRFLLTNYVLGIAFGKVLFLAFRITIEITEGSKEFNAFIELFASWILIQLPFSQCSRTQYIHTLGQQPIANFLNGMLKPE